MEARQSLEGRDVFIARSYIATLILLSIAASVLADFWGVLFVALPGALACFAAALALQLMRFHRLAGRILLALEFAFPAAFFVWSQVRAQEYFDHPPFIVHQVGSALHRHFFPYSPLAIGLVYLCLAIASLPLSIRRTARA